MVLSTGLCRQTSLAMQEAAENRIACQAALLKAGVLDILVGASLGDGAIASVTVRTQART